MACSYFFTYGGNMKVISFDQSSTATGYAVFNNGKLIDYGLIKPKSSKRVKEVEIKKEPHLITITMPEEQHNTTLLRISYICDVIKELIKKTKPHKVYFEEIYMARGKFGYSSANISGFRSLSRLQGQLTRICWECKTPYEIVLESQWISCYGKYSKDVKRAERKADTMKKINSIYGLKITVDDVSDAIALGHAMINKED